MKKLLLSICKSVFLSFCSLVTNAQWQQTNGPYGGTVNALAVSGINIFAGTNEGIFLSTDNGSSWTAVNTGLTNTFVSALAVDGTNILAGTGGGVFLSTNNGSNWTAVNMGLTNKNIKALAVNGSNIFAGTDIGLFLSTNNGSSWNAVNTGLTNSYIKTLAVNGSNVFAGTFGGGVFLSTNNGSSWTAVNSGLTDSYIVTLAVNGTNIFAGTINGGVYLSTNNGSSWTAVNKGLTYKNIKAIAVNGSNIFAGTNLGIFLSTNNGSSWTTVNIGLTNTFINALAINGTNIFAGTEGGGVFISANNGNSWMTVNTGLTNTSVYTLAVSGTNIFAGTQGAGVFLSTDNGNSWTAMNTGLTNTFVNALAVNGTNILAGTGGGVFLSTNNGSSWTAMNTGLTKSDVYSFAVSGTNIFAGKAGVFLSTDTGSSWNAKGLPNTGITALAVSGTNIFAGTYNSGVFLSTDSGSSWNTVNTGLTNSYIKTLAVNGSNILAGTSGGGIFLSADNGFSWVNKGLTNTIIYDLEVSGSNIFAGTSVGVFLSTDNGNNWTAINTGLTNTSVRALAVSEGNLFAGTNLGGVFIRNISEITLFASLSEIKMSCIGTNNGSATANAGGGTPPYTYSWNTNPVQTTAKVSNLPPGTYTVTVKDALGWTREVSVAITDFTSAITASKATTFCQGDSVQLSTNSGASYLWSNGETTQTITVKAAGNYTVTVKDSNNCSATSAATVVTVNSLPIATITANGPTTFCQGDSVQLTASNGTSYLWSNGSTAQKTTMKASGNYTVTVKDNNNCSAISAATAVTANPLPDATIRAINTAIINQGDSATLTVRSNSSYLWSNGASTQNIIAYTSGIYKVKVADINGCINLDSILIDVIPQPINAGHDTSVYPQGCVALKANVNLTKPTTNYKVEAIPYDPDSFNVGTNLILADNAVSNAIPIGFIFNFFGENYNQFYIGSNGWIGFSSGQTKSGKTVPIPDNKGQAPINAIMLKWSDLGAFSLVSTYYKVYGTSPYRRLVVSYYKVSQMGTCGAHDNKPFSGQIVLYETTNIIQFFIEDISSCFNIKNFPIGVQGVHNKTGIKAIATSGRNNTNWGAFHDAIRYTPDGIGTYSVNWFQNDTTGHNKIASDTALVNVCPTATTSYLAQLIDSTTLNVYWDTIGVNINNSSSHPVIIANGATTFCQGDSVKLTASKGSSYLWNTGDTTSSITVGKTGNFAVTIKDSTNNSVTSDTTRVIVNPVYSKNATSTICQGDSVMLGGIYRKTTGTYTDVLKTIQSCDSTITTNLTVLPANTFSQTITKCAGQSVTVGKNTYTKSGTYTDVLISYKGCDSTVTTNLTVLPANTFSQTITKCAGQSVTVGKNTYTKSGTYTDVLASYQGCDSTVTTNLTVLPANTFSQTKTICVGESVRVGTHTYTSNGTYIDTLISSQSCDSIVTTTITMGSPSSCSLVWPGDANHDGVANNFDLLAIGIAYGKTGSVRSNASLNWVGQAAADWADTLSNGTNYKHADCDGNGTINAADTTAILINYGFTHSKTFAGATPTPSDPALSLNITNNTVKAGAPVKVQVGLGTSTVAASNVYGIAFTVNFDPALVDSASLGFDIANSWLGTKNTNLMVLDYNNFSKGTIDLAITRNDHNNTNGFGAIGELSFITSNNFAGNKALNLSVSNVKMISNNETDLPVNLGKDAVIVTGIKTIQQKTISVKIQPNPFSSSATISIEGLNSNEPLSFELYDIVGKKVKQIEGISTRQFTVSKENIQSGIYFYKVSSSKAFVSAGRVVIE